MTLDAAPPATPHVRLELGLPPWVFVVYQAAWLDTDGRMAAVILLGRLVS